MEAKELRIGNLVYRTNKLTKKKLTIKLTASCILDIACNGVMSSYIYEPIPLTEEWLEKLGFEKLKNSNEWYFITIHGFELSIHASGYEICFGSGQTFSLGLSHLSRLVSKSDLKISNILFAE